MKITRIRISNWLGLRHADMVLDQPAAVIAGPNGVGKSSLAEALRFALCAESLRVGLRRDYGQLVTAGQKATSIQIERDGADPLTVTVSTAGKVVDSAAGQSVEPALPYVLDPARFARCAPDERKAFLFGLMGVSMSQDEVYRRLLQRGCDAALVESFLPLLRTGFAHAHREAEKRVSEARGAWKAVAGESYGAVKAKTWRADPGDWKTEEAAQLQGLDATIERLRADHAEAQRRLGAARAEHDRFTEYGKKLAALRARAAEFAVHQDAVNRAEAVLSAAKEALEAARLAAGTAPPAKPATCACPACGVELVRQADGSLAEYVVPPPVPHDPKALEKIPGLQATVADAERTLAEQVARRNAAERAAQDVRAMEDNIPAEPKQHPDIVASSVGMIATELETKVALQRKLRAAYERFDAADRKTKDARAHHVAVEGWQKIAEAMAPDGIPGEILAAALTPINDRLAQTAADTGWMPVRIADDMAITAGGRPYQFLSESERWRSDASIAEAIAHLSGLRLLVLDRFDVLDLRGRADALGWIATMAEFGELDTAIVLGTLKGLPTGLPASIKPFWIERGEVQAPRETEEQAA